jgi:hypothetical protein
MEQRAAIHFFTLTGLKVRAIHTELELVYGPGAPSPNSEEVAETLSPRENGYI